MSESIRELNEHETEVLLKRRQCPDCGYTRFLEGPHGGNCINIQCEGCGSEFNVCPPFFAERISPKQNVQHIVLVRDYNQTYIARSEGTTASCTGGREQAADALARKLMGDKPYSLKRWGNNERAYLVLA